MYKCIMEELLPNEAQNGSRERELEIEAGIHVAFMLGQWLKHPGNLVDLQIADKQRELQDAVAGGVDGNAIGRLEDELRQLKLIKIEAIGVHDNAHPEHA